MRHANKIKFVLRYVLLPSSVVLVIAVAWFSVIYLRGISPGASSHFVINPAASVTRLPDQVEQVESPGIGGIKKSVRIRFTWEQDGYKYSDALVLTSEQYANLTIDQIKAMEKQRFENWVRTINNLSQRP